MLDASASLEKFFMDYTYHRLNTARQDITAIGMGSPFDFWGNIHHAAQHFGDAEFASKRAENSGRRSISWNDIVRLCWGLGLK